MQGQAAVLIPIQKETKYLGVIISYQNFEDASLKHRLSLMHVGFKRLQRWLTGKHGLSVAQRFQLWRTCIYPILSYGIFAMGLSKQGIHKAITQMTIMMRKLTRDHSYLTRRSNQEFFFKHQLPNPAQLLHGTAAGLLRTHQERSDVIPTHDLAHTISWPHLPDLLNLLEHWQAAGSLETSLPLDVEAFATPFFQCAECDFCTSAVSAFRRHCTTVHGNTMHRTHYVDPAEYAADGLPTCRYCGTTFTTWRMFHCHIERGCQALFPGPSPQAGNTGASGARLSTLNPMLAHAADVAARGIRLITPDEMMNLKQQVFGHRLLNLVAERNWESLAADREACQYLSSRCIICSFQFQRCQELHQHYRLQHPALWEHAPQKAIQLTNLFSAEAPCEHCGALFKTHSCPTWSQISVLLVNGAGLDSIEAEPMAEVRHRCELCLAWFPTTADLVQHLQAQHSLHGLSFNESRDALDHSTACSHCGCLFQTMQGLKSHIVQGRCQHFNPQACPETLPVDDLWRQACLDGKLMEILQSPQNRMRLTIVCQACGKGCRRSSDLALHLQSSHARLWRLSKRLTQILVAALYQQQCYCNPSVGTKRIGHICLPLRQLAMSFHRLGHEPFAPMLITEQVLQHVLTNRLQRADRYKLEQALVHRRFADVWQDDDILHLLRRQCLFCSTEMATSDLALHLREEHPCGHEMFLFYMEQLLPTMHAKNPDGYQCHLCQLIYNLPPHMNPEEPAADRVILALSHLRGSCPSLIQVALLFGSLLHGGQLQHGGGRDGCTTADDGSVSAAGPIVSGQGRDSAAASQPQGHQSKTAGRPRKTRFNTSRGHPGRSRGASHADASPHDSTSGQARSRTPKSEKDGSIHSFFEPRTIRSPSRAAPGVSTVEEEDGRCISLDEDATTAASHDNADQPAPVQGGQDRGEQGDRCLVHHITAERGDLGRSQFSISQMGQCVTEVGPRQEAAYQRSKDETASGRAIGHAHRQGAHSPISCTEAGPGPKQPDYPLETADQHAQRQTLRAAFPTGTQCHMDDSWSLDETAHSGPNTAGNHTSVHAAQGQRERQREGTSANQVRALPSNKMMELKAALCGLSFTNDRNWCYGNSTVYNALWTLLCLSGEDLSFWGPRQETLISFICRHASTMATLCNESWFQVVLRDWGNSQSQQDSAECTTHLLAWLSSPAFNMRWERRVELADGFQVCDHNSEHAPILLHIPHDIHHIGHCTLTELVRVWSQEQSMCTALLTAAPCICVSIDRHHQTAEGEVVRSMCTVALDSAVTWPIFTGTHLTCEQADYIVVAGTAHCGQDRAGHCRALLKIQPSLVTMAQPASWLLTDDAQAPLPIWNVPAWFEQSVCVLWMVRSDCLQLPEYQPPVDHSAS